MSREQRGRIVLAWLAGTATVAAGIGLLGTAAYLILRAGRHPPILDLTVAIVGVRFFGIARAGLRYAERLAAHDAALHTAADLRTRTVASLERLTPGGIDRERSADLLDRVTQDVEETQESLVRTTLPPAVAATTVAGTATLCWWIERRAGLAFALGAAASAGLAWIAVIASDRARSRRLTATRTGLTTVIVDLIDGAAEAFVYGRSGDLLAAGSAQDAALLRSERIAAWSTGLGSAVVALGTGVTLWLVLRSGIAAASDGRINTILPGVLAIMALAAFEPITLLPRAAAGRAPAQAARRRLADLAARPDPVPAPRHPAPLPERPVLVLDEAWVRAGATGTWALRGVSLMVEPGRSIALVGPSGAGKTTLAETLLRFRPLDRGRYTVDGVDAAVLDPADIRTVVGLAAEDAHLVDGTVLDNLRLATPDVTAERAGSVLSAVGLGAASERGVVLITHGTEGLETVDEILVLSDGRIVERGTHADLLAAGGTYAARRSVGT